MKSSLIRFAIILFVFLSGCGTKEEPTVQEIAEAQLKGNL